jgi:hypothetical protein
MKDKINSELTKLQTELGNLGNAVSQISKAEKLSNELLSTVKEIQQKYDSQFEKIISHYDSFLAQNSKLGEEHIVKTSEKYVSDVENTRQALAQISAETQNLLNETKDQIGVLVAHHSSQITETNNLLQSYLELAKATTALSVQIEKVDFPVRLDKISINIGEMNSEIRQIQSHIKSIADDPVLMQMEARMRRTNKKLNWLTVLVVISLLLLAGLTYEIIVIKYLPGLALKF